MIQENRKLHACALIYLPPELLLEIGLAHRAMNAQNSITLDDILICATRAKTGPANYEGDTLTQHAINVLYYQSLNPKE